MVRIVNAGNEDFNRKLIEQRKCDIIVSLESSSGKDYSKKLSSGLNEILARLSAKNKISIGIDFSDLSPLNKTEKGKRLARIIQNIRLCRKYGTKIKLINYKNKITATNFLISLGASTKQAQDSIN